MASKLSVAVGQVFTSKEGEQYRVVDYKKAYNGVTIEFLSTGNQVVCSAKEVRSGKIKNYMRVSVHGKGYIGEGKYLAKPNGKPTREYLIWAGMLRRVYHEAERFKHPTYSHIEVCEEWFNFQSFAEWCQGQVGFDLKDKNGASFVLDKDLLTENSKVYSPATCCFLPTHINSALQGRQRDKDEDLPSGVYRKPSGRYVAKSTKAGTHCHLGVFDSAEEAKAAYRKFKTGYLQSLAEEYKNVISEEAYRALTNINLESRSIYNTAWGEK